MHKATTSDKKHILIIPSWYPEKAGDVGGSFFREQAIALKKRGYTVGVIAPMFRSVRNIKGLFIKPYGCRYQDDAGVNTYRYFSISIPKLSRIARARWVNSGLELYKKYVERFGVPDVIHVHSMINAGFVAWTIRDKFDIPYVITEHSTAFARGLVSEEDLRDLKPVIEASSFNIAVSNEFAKLLREKTGITTWRYIPNIVNDDFISSQLTSSGSGFGFVNICLLDKKKKLDVLIKSFARAFAGNKEITLTIGGDGPERASLERLAKQLDVESQVNFLGMLTRERVKEEVSKADAFVLSSEYETFGVVVVEALALGKPVIATRCGGPESIVNDEVGYLVDVNDVEQMSSAMNQLYRNKENFEPAKIKQYCIDNFSEKAVIDRLAAVYSLVTNEK